MKSIIKVYAPSDLFNSVRVDYFEVFMTQRDALESKLELIETKKEQLKLQSLCTET